MGNSLSSESKPEVQGLSEVPISSNEVIESSRLGIQVDERGDNLMVSVSSSTERVPEVRWTDGVVEKLAISSPPSENRLGASKNEASTLKLNGGNIIYYVILSWFASHLLWGRYFHIIASYSDPNTSKSPISVIRKISSYDVGESFMNGQRFVALSFTSFFQNR